LLQFKKYHPPENLKSNNLGIFQSLELRSLILRILRISLKLNFTPNTLGCHRLTHYRPAMPFGNQKKYFRGIFQFSVVTIQKLSTTGNLKSNYLGIFKSLKSRISMEKNPLISLKLYFTPNT